jgi:hypothetical protein
MSSKKYKITSYETSFLISKLSTNGNNNKLFLIEIGFPKI